MKRGARKKESHWTRLGRSVLPTPKSAAERRRLRWRLLTVGGLLIAIWLTFFDSHSLLKRVRWHGEHAQLVEENTRLRAEIDRLEREVEKGLSDEMIEEIAREQYGMRRPGETVYRVEEAE